jgi:DnaJ-class molecular chaperone
MSTCAWCHGSGTLPVDVTDRRKGEKTCHHCGGYGVTKGSKR